MRQKLLLSTAALLAGIAMASAQGTTGGGMTGGAGGGMSGGKNAGSTAGHERQPSTQGRSGQSEQGTTQQRAEEQAKPGQSQRGEQSGRREQTTGQAGERNSGHAAQTQPNSSVGGKEQERTTGQSQRQPESKTTGQNQRQPENNMSQTQKREPGRMQGQAPQHETAGQGPGREQGQFQARQGQPQQAQRQSEGGRMALSSEQRTKIRETVMAGNNVPRVDNVNFAVREGTVVPGSVRVMEVPDSFIAIYPQWRGDEYFVVRDEIVIVDHDRRIVSVVPTGSSGGSMEARGSSAINLSQEQIRDLQTALSRQGFDIGEVDGRLGPRTERALMEFQKRQGLQATGHFDQRTVEALGINAGGQQGNRGEPSSTGQAGSSMQQPSANPRTGAGSLGTPGAGEPSTSGQSGRPMQPAPVNPGASSNPGAAPDAGANPQSGAGTQMRERAR
jgi:peptidoglycan hydrolase-like protein with peptidoglycan-binding domain